jgi:hypothetical protein
VEAERQLANTVDDTQLSLIEARALLNAMDGKGYSGIYSKRRQRISQSHRAGWRKALAATH